jgi:hypothetical protein
MLAQIEGGWKLRSSGIPDPGQKEKVGDTLAEIRGASQGDLSSAKLEKKFQKEKGEEPLDLLAQIRNASKSGLRSTEGSRPVGEKGKADSTSEATSTTMDDALALIQARRGLMASDSERSMEVGDDNDDEWAD